MKIDRIRHIIISFLFASILLFVFVDQKLKIFNPDDKIKENRKLAEMPVPKIAKLDYFPERYEKYYNDNFQNRSWYIKRMTDISCNVLGKANIQDRYLLVDDDWMFEMRKNLPWFIGEYDFSDQQLKKFSDELSKRQDYFNSIGVEMYILVIPCKFSIYPEKLPSPIDTIRKTRTDDFINYHRKTTNVHVVDGRKSLLKRKSDQVVYLKYDTHWNGYGAYYALSDLIDTMRNKFHTIPKYTISDYFVDSVKKSDGNLIRNLPDAEYLIEYDIKFKKKDIQVFNCPGFEHQKPEKFPYPQEEYCRKYCSDNKLNQLKLLVIRDSYANHSFSILPAHFNEVMYLWDNWEYKLNKDIVEKEKPDIVLYMIYEGYLENFIEHPSFVEPEDFGSEIQ